MPDNFVLHYHSREVQVQMHSIAGRVIFRVIFPDGPPPLLLTRAKAPGQVKFWTSVPEGRQKEAEEIGPLIEQFYRTNK